MRGFIAMGGGVGLGRLTVTHGLGSPGQSPPPPPPPPPANADEREAEWEWKRKELRDWDEMHQYQRYQWYASHEYAKYADFFEESAKNARAEQRRLEASDFVRRFSAEPTPDEWLHPLRPRRQQWETGGTAPTTEPVGGPAAPTAHAPIDAETAADVVASIEESADAGPTDADYAILPVGDRALIEALADGALQYVMDPSRGLMAILETDGGKRFVYGRIGSIPPRRVKAGETIGLTPPAANDVSPPGPIPEDGIAVHATELLPGYVESVPSQLGPHGPSAFVSDPSQWTKMYAPQWVTSRRPQEHQPAAAHAGDFGGGPPFEPFVPMHLARAPKPPSRKGLGLLMLLGLGVMAVVKGSGRRRH
jgi:hypothetical protein